MYNAYFGFRTRPFAPVPQAEHYFPAATIEAARVTLVRCIERGEGAGMVVGPSGTGKTLLCQLLVAELKDCVPVALLQSGRLSTRRNLLQAILYALGRPYRDMDEGELRLALVDYLTASEECAGGIVLLVDEAHTLPLRLLEELRMLTNLVRNGQLQVRLVLAGSRLLEERFASPKLDSFGQRLAARCYLEPLGRAETEQYIHAQINSAGGAGEAVFPSESCQNVHQATDGVPRLVNQLCDHALVLAYIADRKQIEPATIEEAWADLQQLPTPWNGQAQDATAGGIIEFGGLEEQPSPKEKKADEAGEKPRLRISPESSEAEIRVPEPAEQVRRIEELLSAAGEEEFRPAGSIGPEVELVFEEPQRLLQEKFTEEELVVDHYVGTEAQRARRARAAGEEAELAEAVARGRPREEEALAGAGVETAAGGGLAAMAEPQAAVCPVAPVKRREYARLFARLRRS